MNFILIDGSYYIFFRYYSLKTWWSFARHPDEPEKIEECDRCMDKFRSTFISKIEEIPEKLEIENPIIMVGKDCPQNTIWRNEFIENYKGNRNKTDNVKPMFEATYGEDLFKQGGAKTILEYPTLEADDCIAITAKHIIDKYPDAHVYIITSDMDYIQLACERITLINLKYQKLTDSKSCFKDPQKDLFCKIVSGDKSDNIPSVFPRCGLKTSAKLYENQEEFIKKLEKNPEAKDLYEQNKKIIDFNHIPNNLIDGFKKNILLI